MTQGSLTAGQGGSAGITFKPYIVGDFTAQIDYTFLNWPTPDNKERLGFGDGVNPPMPLVVERVSDSGFGGDVYLTHFPNGVQGNTSTQDTSGKLRLTRVADTVSGYYWNGTDWTMVASYSTGGENSVSRLLGAAIWAENPATVGVKVSVDNFSLNAPNTPNPVPLPAAVWLFGSGLLGLIGVARRKKAA